MLQYKKGETVFQIYHDSTPPPARGPRKSGRSVVFKVHPRAKASNSWLKKPKNSFSASCLFFMSRVKMNIRKIWFISCNGLLKVGVIVTPTLIWRIHKRNTKQQKHSWTIQAFAGRLPTWQERHAHSFPSRGKLSELAFQNPSHRAYVVFRSWIFHCSTQFFNICTAPCYSSWLLVRILYHEKSLSSIV